MNEILIKHDHPTLTNEWKDKSYVLDYFPVGKTTYDNKLNVLKNSNNKNLTKRINGKMFIHDSIIKDTFLLDRVPSYNQPHQIRKWVDLKDWDIIGNITPLTSDIPTNVELINRFHKLLKKNYRSHDHILFYSVEMDPNQDHYHTHFLIDFKGEYICSKELESLILSDLLLKEFIGYNTHKYNNRLRIEEYDKEAYDKKGVRYSYKEENKIGLLKNKNYN